MIHMQETSGLDGILRKNAAPRVVLISSPSKLQYFVVAEKQVLGEYPCLQDALFFCFAAYYVYHLEYPAQVKNMFYFFQDFVVRHPDSHDRSGTYLATTSDIKRNIWVFFFLLWTDMPHNTIACRIHKHSGVVIHAVILNISYGFMITYVTHYDSL